MGIVTLLQLLMGIFTGVLLPIGVVVFALSWPLQKLADRVRPAPTQRNYAGGLIASILLPAAGFLALCIGFAAFHLLTYRPSILMNEPLVAAWILLLAFIGITGNLAYSAYRTREWYALRRTAA